MRLALQQAVALSESGKKSQNSQYIFPSADAINSSDRLFILCEGDGPEGSGKEAAKIVASSISEYFAAHSPGEAANQAYLEAALAQAQEKMSAHLLSHPEHKEMNSRLALLFMTEQNVTVAWVGDMRIYHYQTEWNRLAKYGAPKGALAYASSRIRGSHEPADIKSQVLHQADLKGGDTIMLCSNSIEDQIAEKDLAEILGKAEESAAEKLSAIKNLSEGFIEENYTCLVLELEGKTEEIPAAPPPATQETGSESKTRAEAIASAMASPSKEPVTESEPEPKANTRQAPPPTGEEEEDDIAEAAKKIQRKKKLPIIPIVGIVLALLLALAAIWWFTKDKVTKNFEEYVNRGDMLLDQREYDQAILMYDSAYLVAKDQNQKLIASSLRDKARKRSLAASGEEPLESLTKTPEEYLAAAEGFFRAGNYQEAALNYRRTERVANAQNQELEGFPFNHMAESFAKIGDAHYTQETRDCEGAIKNYETALGIMDRMAQAQDPEIYRRANQRLTNCREALGLVATGDDETVKKKEEVPAPSGTDEENASQESSKKTVPEKNEKETSPTEARKALASGKEMFKKARQTESTADYKQAAKYLQKAESQLDGPGAYMLSYLYYMGYGVKKDKAKALKYSQRSALKGWAAGHYLYAHQLLLRRNPGDTITARESLKKAADDNYLQAFDRLNDLP